MEFTIQEKKLALFFQFKTNPVLIVRAICLTVVLKVITQCSLLAVAYLLACRVKIIEEKRGKKFEREEKMSSEKGNQ